MLDYGTRVALLRLLRKFRTGGKDNENQGQRERVVDGSCAGFVRAGRWNWSSAPDSGKRRSGVGCQWWRADSALAVDEWRCTDPAIALEQIAAWSYAEWTSVWTTVNCFPTLDQSPVALLQDLGYARASETGDTLN